MRPVFADTLYWVALLNPADPWRAPALSARDRLRRVTLVATDEVLDETLAAVAAFGAHYRREAARMVHRLHARGDMTVVPQSRTSFLAGLDLYERRPDKAYSLTDCISMNAMRERGITDVLTNDHHFEQEGFNVLIRR
jgi:predicted nucleic acid-binding protein